MTGEIANAIITLIGLLIVAFMAGFYFGDRSGEETGRALGKLDADRERSLKLAAETRARMDEMQAELDARAKAVVDRLTRGAK